MLGQGDKITISGINAINREGDVIDFHVSFPIELRCNGYDFEGEDTTYIIGNKDWDNINLFDTIIDGQKVSTIIDESKNMATMRGEECGILVHYMFKKSNGTWILHKIIDSTN